MIEYVLRPVGSKTVLVKLVFADRERFVWRPRPGAAPAGRLQWYWRRLGKKRWFRWGDPFSYFDPPPHEPPH